ncbi:glycosyltransferase [Lacticaseibacillus rhamnosus]|uniref:glycosyltransferase n=1 Tax=Lacticaseibacillus rhamnosus TaxID=47715 RepID=UPI00237FCDD0|nr:glycosyltransferase family 2 protein [Lacticaseibacillus rhamnosus]MDE3295329.1 glycosyltransferase family 2 protein [Lacticaseibacillus rhamnosus]
MLKIGIILNYRNYQQTISCCTHLLKAGIDQVTIVDNDSPNDSFHRLHEFFGQNMRVSILKTDANLGYAQGNNIGLRAVENKFGIADDHILFIVNPDSLLSPENIEQVATFCLSHPEAGTVTIPQKGNPKTAWHNLTKRRALLYNSRIFSKLAYRFGKHEEVVPYKLNQSVHKNIKVDVNSGAFFAIRQVTFSKVGYFDSETFLYYEEQALAFKLQQHGFQSYLLLTSSYIHEGQGSTQLTTRKVLGYYQQSRRYLLTQYLHAGSLALWFYDWTIRLEDVLAHDLPSGKA